MNTVNRWFSAVMAVLVGLSTLMGALIQCVTGLGYDSKPVEAIEANYLEGSDSFIDEATSDKWKVGYGRNVLTPNDVDDYEYFLAGFLTFPANTVTGVIDDLCVRAVCLDDNSGRGAVAFAWIDCVGIMNEDIKAIRAELSDITGNGELININVGATHTHSGIDTQGLWGFIPKSGRDQKYMDVVIEKTADAIRTAYESMKTGTLYYASEEHPEMFTDSRAPEMYDTKVHLFHFVPDDGSKETYIANFGAHPVNLGGGNTDLSGDYPYYIEKAINEKADADFAFIQGAIGGGIGANRSATNGIDETLPDFDRMSAFADKMADTLIGLTAKETAVEPILNVKHAQVEFMLTNFVFKLAATAQLCNAYLYLEDNALRVTSEIGYVEIGKNIKTLLVPGEVLPEVVYGGFYGADESFTGTEYGYAPLADNFAETDEVLVFGLCNDALGYFVPDNDYSSKGGEGHYEETVSTGSKSASALSVAFHELLK